MTRGKISLGRAHFSRQFPGWAGPEEVDDVAIATLPLGASGRWNDLRHVGFVLTQQPTVVGTPVPDGLQFWVPFCSAYHDDGALTAHLRIVMVNLAGNEVVMSGGADVTANRHISLRRPIILPEGWHLRVRLSATPAATKKLFLNYYYVETPIGEYVAPL